METIKGGNEVNCSCDGKYEPPTMRVTVNGYERIVSFLRGYDCERPRNSPRSHGIACVDLTFMVKNELGTVQFKLLTGWYPSWRARNSSLFPLPSDLGYHSPVPRYEGQKPISGSCEWLDGRPCYYDGSSLNAEEPFDILIMKGESALWNYLENYHKRIFQPELIKEKA